MPVHSHAAQVMAMPYLMLATTTDPVCSRQGLRWGIGMVRHVRIHVQTVLYGLGKVFVILSLVMVSFFRMLGILCKRQCNLTVQFLIVMSGWIFPLWSERFLFPEGALFSCRHPRLPPVRLPGLRPLQESAKPLHEAGSSLVAAPIRRPRRVGHLLKNTGIPTPHIYRRRRRRRRREE